MKSVLILFTILIASTASADDDTQKNLRDFASNVCDRAPTSDSRRDCYDRTNKFLAGRDAPADEQALASAKLEISQSLCVGNSGIADNCWSNVEKRLNDERRQAEKGGGTDSYRLAESVSRAVGTCSEQKGRFIFKHRDIDADCLREKVAGLQTQVASGNPATLSPTTQAAIASTSANPSLGAANGTSTMNALPCTAGTDRGTEVKIGEQSPLGDGAKLIVYPSGVTLWTGPKDARSFYNSKSGWLVIKGNREKGTVSDVADGQPGKLLEGKITLEYKRDSLIIRRTDKDPVIVTTVKLPQEQSADMIRDQVNVTTAAGAALGSFTSQISTADNKTAQARAQSDIDAIAIKKERKRAKETYEHAALDRMLSGPAASANLGPSSQVVRNGCSIGTTDVAASASAIVPGGQLTAAPTR